MWVNLKRNFFAPDGSERRVVDNPHNLPDDWTLPSGAEKVKDKLDEDGDVIPPKPVAKK